jgi:hypothetical protein
MQLSYDPKHNVAYVRLQEPVPEVELFESVIL